MKNTPLIIRHGEVLLKPIPSIPKDAVLQYTKNKIVVAHSETGHHHILESAKGIDVYTLNGETCLKVTELGKIWHQKEGDYKHKTHEVQPSVYQIIIKKQFDYFTRKLQQVRD